MLNVFTLAQGRLVQQVNQNYQQLRENFLGRKV